MNKLIIGVKNKLVMIKIVHIEQPDDYVAGYDMEDVL